MRPAILALLTLLLPAAAARTEDCAGMALRPGLCLANQETFDAIANIRGGVRRGVAGMSQTEMDLSADFGRIAGLEGWTAQVSTLLLLGRQITSDRIGAMAPASGIEAVATFRLNEVWVERQFSGWGALRLGQIAIDSEFAVAEGAINLVSGTFAWPVAFGSNLPGSGHGYPMAGPGARLTLGKPDAGTGLRFAVLAGNPAGRYAPETNPQRHDRYGTVFSFAGGALMIAEATTGGTKPDDDSPRPWVAKLGAWYHNGGFDSQRYDSNGVSLASPASNGQPWRYGNGHGVYAVLEAVLAREGSTALLGYVRALAQQPDRSLVSLQVDGGLVWRAPFGRSGDAASLGVSWARIGDAARGLDRDSIAFGNPTPIRGAEMLIELNYALTLVPERLWIQPLAQLFVNPAAGAPDERRSATRPLPNAVSAGLRVVLQF